MSPKKKSIIFLLRTFNSSTHKGVYNSKMGRYVGIEPTHARATIWCVNHFTNTAISNVSLTNY